MIARTRVTTHVLVYEQLGRPIHPIAIVSTSTTDCSVTALLVQPSTVGEIQSTIITSIEKNRQSRLALSMSLEFIPGDRDAY